MVPSRSTNSMSSGIQVFFIQNERGRSSGKTNSIPWSCSSAVRYIRPRARVSSDSASSMRIRGLCGAPTKLMAPQASSGGPVGSAGQFAAGSAGAGASAGDGTTQGPDDRARVTDSEAAPACAPGERVVVFAGIVASRVAGSPVASMASWLCVSVRVQPGPPKGQRHHANTIVARPLRALLRHSMRPAY